ncbi:hypothetical protein Lal_00044613, partial [Lupinus albus]
IDISFVRDMLTDRNDLAIVSAIVAMAKSLGLKTLAEGVEEAAQAEHLLALGCDEAQGYYFARPEPAEVFARRWLQSACPSHDLGQDVDRPRARPPRDRAVASAKAHRPKALGLVRPKGSTPFPGRPGLVAPGSLGRTDSSRALTASCGTSCSTRVVPQPRRGEAGRHPGWCPARSSEWRARRSGAPTARHFRCEARAQIAVAAGNGRLPVGIGRRAGDLRQFLTRLRQGNRPVPERSEQPALPPDCGIVAPAWRRFRSRIFARAGRCIALTPDHGEALSRNRAELFRPSLTVLGLWAWSKASSDPARVRLVRSRLLHFGVGVLAGLGGGVGLEVVARLSAPACGAGRSGACHRRCGAALQPAQRARDLRGAGGRCVVAAAGWRGSRLPVDVCRPGWLVTHGGRYALPGRRAGRLGAGLGLHRALGWLISFATAAAQRGCSRRPCRGTGWLRQRLLLIRQPSSRSKGVRLWQTGRDHAVLQPRACAQSGRRVQLLAGASGWQRYFFITLGLLVAVWLIRQLKQTLPRFEAVGYSLILGGGTWQRGGSPAARSGCGLPRLPLAGHALARVQLADVAISIGVGCLIARRCATPATGSTTGCCNTCRRWAGSTSILIGDYVWRQSRRAERRAVPAVRINGKASASVRTPSRLVGESCLGVRQARQSRGRRNGDPVPAATSVIATSNVSTVCSRSCSAFSNTRCTVTRHGSSAVDCEQIKAAVEHFLARHFTVGQQVGALGHGDRQRVMPQRLAYPARPLPGSRRQGEVEAVARQLRASTGICPSGQDGMSLRLFGALQGEHVGELGRHPFAEDGHANFGGDVTRFHVQLPPGGELVATDLEAVE